MSVDVAQLFTMSQSDIDSLFRQAQAGPVPDGPSRGTAIIAPGTPCTADLAQCINLFVWQGKVFDAAHGRLINRIGVFGVNAVIADVYKAPSWFDQQECIVLDYSRTSFIAQRIRDEIRLLQPKFYLGRMYWDRQPLMNFTLQFD